MVFDLVLMAAVIPIIQRVESGKDRILKVCCPQQTRTLLAVLLSQVSICPSTMWLLLAGVRVGVV